MVESRKTFVLVHGAWHGGWCWRRVADLLQAKGHKVYTPTLTGVGERSHLMSKDITLDTHIADIVNLFRWENLRDVCLAAHSYGGWPCSGALEHIHDRVTSIVWVDAFIPADGQRGVDFASGFSKQAMDEAMAKGLPGRAAPPPEAFGVNEKDRAWVKSKLTDQPNGVSWQPIRLTGKGKGIAKKTYIRAPSYAQPAFDKALAECRTDKSWKLYLANDAGHDIMIDAPEWLADILVKES
jgi:pimeloyl-ACP methyl ester carboxylesterase